MHVSLDGFVAGPNGEIDWVYFDDDLIEDVQSLVNTADTALFGRVTYQLMESYWPNVASSPTATKHDLDHSHWLNPAPKIVFSRTLKNVHWQNTRIVVSEFVSLDGVMQAPGGREEDASGSFKHGGWSFKFRDDQVPKYKLDELAASDALLLGRKTYEIFAAYWPKAKDDAGFADKM